MNDRICSLLRAAIDEKVFTCASYLIGNKRRVLDQGTLGTLGIGRGEAPTSTIYDLASVTKVLAALAFMRLLEKGKACLDDTVSLYLPEYRGTNKADITLFQLLTHTSVLHGQTPLYLTCHDRQALLQAILALPPRKNDTVEYSSAGMIVLGRVMEAIERKPLDTILQDEVFSPLAMSDTLFNPPENLWPRIASTEDCPWRGHVVIGQVHDENAVVLGGVSAHAGAFSTALDLSQIARMMLTGCAPDGTPYLSDAARQVMTKNHTAGMNLTRGLGWQLKDPVLTPAGDLFSERSYGHTGFTGTSIWIDPEQSMYAVLLTNRVHPVRAGNGIVRVRHIFHNLAVLLAESTTKNEMERKENEH